MAVILEITIPGNPHPKERPRSGSRGTYTPPKTVAAEKAIQDACKPLLTGEPTALPLRVTLRFRRADNRGADLDNLTKTVWDALNKVAFHDDRQVLELDAQVTRGCKVDPSTYIRIETL